MIKQPLAAALLLSGFGATWADCEHSRDLTLDLDASAATELQLKAKAGSLDVRGVEGLDQVRLVGRACASSERLLEEMALVDESRGDRLRVYTDIPDSSGGWMGNRYAYIDLEVQVPSMLALEIHDGSGETRLVGIGPATIKDGSGELEIEDTLGAIEINDGSGEIEIRNAGGDVRIVDGSGEIEIDTVAGNVLIEEDGSGEIDIRNVERDVLIVDDGSGSIDITSVVGSVTIEDDGSGGINVRDVGGDLTIENDGSGGVRFANVQGRTDVPGEELK